MAYLRGEPFTAQFIDPATGLLMQNGTIEFYLSGTSTPTPYYTNSTGTSGGTSLTLDSGGQPPNNIFFDDGISYKIVTKNASGATLRTIDPYNVISNESSVFKRQYIADLTSEAATIGNIYMVEDYASGNNAGVMYFRAVAAGTGTADGGSYIDHDTLSLQFERIFNSVATVKDFGAIEGGDITSIITAFMSSSLDEIHLGPHSFTADENWPYQPTDGKKIKGVRNRTTLTYVGAAGTLGNEIEFIKLRTAARGAVSGGGFEDIKVDLNNVAYVRGLSLVYFTNQSAVGGIEVGNIGVGSEGIVCDKLWYTNWGPIAVINNPVAKTGAGIVLRPTTDGNDSVNSHNFTQVRLQGLEHNILLDTTTAGINTVKIQGSSESGTNGVTHIGVFGVSEADINLHMESNVVNVRWEGGASAGPGKISWGGRWNNAAGGAVKIGHSYHYINAKTIGAIDLFKWGAARVKLEGAVFTDKGGTTGTEDVGAVTYTAIEDVSSIPGWRESQQTYVNVNLGNWIKGASATSFATTTGYVEYDFSDTITPVSDYSAVKITAAYLRPDGSRKVYVAMALKRPADTGTYLLTQIGGDALDASFDVQLTAAGLFRIKSSVSENILYVGRVDPM